MGLPQLQVKGFPTGSRGGSQRFLTHHDGFTCGFTMGTEKLLPGGDFTTQDRSGLSQPPVLGEGAQISLVMEMKITQRGLFLQTAGRAEY